ncbi:MAG: protein disulfide isomerase family protein [bacterium]
MKKDQIIFISVFVVIIGFVIGGVVLMSNQTTKATVDDGRVVGIQTFDNLVKISGCFVPPGSDSKMGNEYLAKCLTDKKWVMYGASWCPHCKDQKAMFGEAVKYLTAVECDQKVDLCTAKDIRLYPTWLKSTDINSTSTTATTSVSSTSAIK